MINELLVTLASSVLGNGKRTARGNKAFTCPFCNHHKPKLEVNFTENKKGRYLSTLFKKVDASYEKIQELKSLVKNGFDTEEIIIKTKLKLPKEFTSILESKDIIAKHALVYLKNRGITIDDIEKYNIGYCESGRYAKMIIIPSYDNKGNLNYFTGRSFEKDPYIKYKNPEVSRDIIPNEHLINWNLPLVICEGMFDAIAIKRNAIPLLGKNIQSTLMKKIVTSTIKKLYIALDKDAQKQSLDFCKKFIDEGKEVYLVEIKDKDPSEMGFKQFTNLIQKTEPLTYSNLMEKKIMLS